jgi:hypothetical protein
MPLQDQLCKWPSPNVRWTIIGIPGTLAFEAVKAAYTLAWSQWADVCVLRPEYVGPTQPADVLMGAGLIDQPGQVLAWSEMPCGAHGPLRQMFDTAENWTIAENPVGNSIDLVRVACHEIGHALGIPHITDGNLMAPIYSPSIRKPKAGDILEAVQRYGRPQPPGPPAPPVPLPPGPQQTISLVIAGQIVSASIPGFKVEKLP